jgi:hypothetical protein
VPSLSCTRPNRIARRRRDLEQRAREEEPSTLNFSVVRRRPEKGDRAGQPIE